MCGIKGVSQDFRVASGESANRLNQRAGLGLSVVEKSWPLIGTAFGRHDDCCEIWEAELTELLGFEVILDGTSLLDNAG